MILSNSAFETPVEISENTISMLVVENKEFAAAMIKELIYMSENNTEGKFFLSEEGKDIALSEVEIITDFYRPDFNNRKLVNKLLSLLSKKAVDEAYYERTYSLVGEIYSFADSIVNEFDFCIETDEPAVQDIFKICNIKFISEKDSLAGNLLDYFKIYRELLGTKLFIAVNLRKSLPDHVINEFYKDVMYNKYNLLLIETEMPRTRLQCEKYKIIDKDLCEIT